MFNSLSLLIKPAGALCNMNCSYCFYKKTASQRASSFCKIMSSETVAVLLDKAFEENLSSIYISFQGGEPTLAGLDFFKSFIDAVNKRNKKGIPVSYALQTNGILIDDEFAKFLAENKFLVGISLDGDRNTNNRFRLGDDGKSTFDTVLDAISLLEKHKADFNILSVITNESAGEIKRTYKFFKNRNLKYLQFIPFVDDCFDESISLSCEEYERFLKKLFDLWYNDLVGGKYVSVRTFDNYINLLCGYPAENCAMLGVCGGYFVVEANGDIYPCDFYCTDEYRLGSVFDEKPFEKKEKHREFFMESLLIKDYCKNCKYAYLCRGGCKKDRTDHFTKNKYCSAYYNFFEYAAERMQSIAKRIKTAQI